jgi:hypothetical protein
VAAVLKEKIRTLCLILSDVTAVLAGPDVSEWLTTEAALTLETYVLGCNRKPTS